MRSRNLMLSLLALAPACASESNEMLPVSTTAGGASSSAQSSAEAKRRDNGFARFVLAIPDVPSVDVYANDMRIFTGAAYGTVTPYRELGDTDYDFIIRSSGKEMSTPMAKGAEDVDAGHHYTVVAIKKAGSTDAEMVVFDDDLVPPKAGSANLRLINASPDAGELDLYTPGAEDALFEGVNVEKASTYKEIKPMIGKLRVHREDEKSALIELPITSFDAGKIYTVIVFGSAGATPASTKAIIVEDRFGTQ